MRAPLLIVGVSVLMSGFSSDPGVTNEAATATNKEKVRAARKAPVKAVTIAGNVWRDFEEAKAEAKESGKPILHLQLFGKLEDEFC